ncbi:DUF1573 domain-containing protein [Taibaiella lutea]|uniref:DUF1573 domain-containing protein n=1 Tax=Taibaiella lutea TaxID=2608001 RepID=A0A5M6CKM5_9BACT|nr:DUF1573 domain-containing protein [Taibaiella lutea]KAA5534980.1 DUF1573 domain-containing protein [Taibaiella lutea]
MKKSILSLAVLAFAATGVFAQGKKLEAAPKATTTPQVVNVSPTDNKAAEPTTTIKFKEETHDFGTLKEGDPAEYEFSFTNTGKKPLILTDVHPGCGCTTPTWSKDPVMPGKTGVIKASYGTKGRVGAFNKNITVTSNAGTNVIYIKGTVEKAPEASAPQNESVIKSN